MLSQSDRMWNENEIKELIQLAQYLRNENEELQAKMIMMDAKLRNEESKVRRLTQLLIYAKGNQLKDTDWV
jgi:hypothetical protein